MRDPSLARLSNEELLKQLLHAVSTENGAKARTIRYLIEVEERGYHLDDACSSIFEFCVVRLRMSEGAAFLRMTCARLVKRFPSLAKEIEEGEISLSVLAKLRDHLTAKNFDELVAAVRGKTKRQVSELLAERQPWTGAPAPPAKIRKLPKMKTGNAISPALERELEAIAEMRYRLGLTLDREERDEVLLVRDMMMHRNPSGDLKAVFMAGVRTLRRELERQIYGLISRPKDSKKKKKKKKKRMPSVAKTRGSVPRPVRREVFERDGRRCTHTNAKGDRCRATAHLELDHIVTPSDGGTEEAHNLRVRCRPHNRRYAELVYGKEYVEKKVHASQLKSRQKANGATAASP